MSNIKGQGIFKGGKLWRHSQPANRAWAYLGEVIKFCWLISNADLKLHWSEFETAIDRVDDRKIYDLFTANEKTFSNLTRLPNMR